MRKKILILLVLALAVIMAGLGAWYYWTHRYDKLIVAAAQRHGIDPMLVKAIIYEESFFSPRAQSSQNAVGLMQVTPIVAQELIEATRSHTLAQAIASLTGGPPTQRNLNFEEAFSDPVVSLNVGCWYLKTLLNRYGDEPDPVAVALAAYNAGPANVERWASNSDRSNLSREEFIARIEFPVTRNYVQKIIQRYDYYKRDRDIKQ
ncbi:MAG TPA: lytic transglycosylase domain-containing protein [Blastocatellia bacterium]|nr:lytic transglycosylase domain-containing protein [Blastocatellia bacterium]